MKFNFEGINFLFQYIFTCSFNKSNLIFEQKFCYFKFLKCISLDKIYLNWIGRKNFNNYALT